MAFQKLSDLMGGFVKIISICMISGVGLIGGALVSYLAAGLLYLTVFGNGPVKNGYECGRGMLVAYLSIFGGGLLGACVAAYAAIRSYGSPSMPGNYGVSLTQPGGPSVSSVPKGHS